MTVAAWLVWGFIATLLLTTLLAGSQRLGYTRMSLPYLLGTLFTPDRDRARLLGILVHLANGWLFALAYFALFRVWGAAGWWRGALAGALHGVVILALAFPLLPSLHPRMASEEQGPVSRRQLEPPGFFGLHYGLQTPLWILLAHIAYGAFLGAVA